VSLERKKEKGRATTSRLEEDNEPAEKETQ
jgi:hypothetical protein